MQAPRPIPDGVRVRDAEWVRKQACAARQASAQGLGEIGDEIRD